MREARLTWLGRTGAKSTENIHRCSEGGGLAGQKDDSDRMRWRWENYCGDGQNRSTRSMQRNLKVITRLPLPNTLKDC